MTGTCLLPRLISDWLAVPFKKNRGVIRFDRGRPYRVFGIIRSRLALVDHAGVVCGPDYRFRRGVDFCIDLLCGEPRRKRR
jgi:hypothetical protein